MSSEAPKYLYVAWAPDYTDPDALTRRLAVRTQHLEGLKAYFENGTLGKPRRSIRPALYMLNVGNRLRPLVHGGAMVDSESLSPSVTAKKMEGSIGIFKANSAEEVRKITENDIYWISNVWDKEKLEIKPLVALSDLIGM